MKKLLTLSYKILRNNLIFIQPFLLYLLVLMMAVPYFVNNNVQIYPKIILMISVYLLSIANISGWFYINKKAVEEYDENDSKEEITIKAVKNFKCYFTGVGEYFFKSLLGSLLFFAFYFVLFYAITKVCLATLGEPVIADRINELANFKTVAEISAFLDSFTLKDILIFKLWVIILTLSVLCINFMALLYFTLLFFKKDNFIKSFFIMLGFFFKNIFGSIYIMLFMFVLYIFLNVFAMIFGVNSIGFTLFIIFSALYLNYYILLVFCFYNDKTKINSDIGPEQLGENRLSD